MTGPSREEKLSAAFVTLADTLVADFDVVELMQTLVETCVDVLDVRAGGLLLRSLAGELHVVASSTEDAELVEVVQLDARSGPCWDCVTTGQPVTVAPIESTADRWPAFHDAALERGFHSEHSAPMRLRDTVVGAMNLYSTSAEALNAEDIAVAQALSDVATIGILTERAARERDVVAAQLENALGSRVVIEQAKGFLAQSFGVSMNDAFVLLRSFSRSHRIGLSDVARSVVERRLPLSELRPRTRGGQEQRDR